MFYRPPAKALLDVLPVGAPLMLLAEPTNENDPNAIAVWLDAEAIPEAAYEKLSDLLIAYGFDLENVLAQKSWHVGYIPRDLAAALRAEGTVPSDEPVNVTFSVSPSGAPRVRLNGGMK
jgi:hypothetical protein